MDRKFKTILVYDPKLVVKADVKDNCEHYHLTEEGSKLLTQGKVTVHGLMAVMSVEESV